MEAAEALERTQWDLFWLPARRFEGLTVRRVETLEDLRAAVEVSARAFGTRPPREDAERAGVELRLCTGPRARVQRFVAFDTPTGTAIAAAGMTVHPTLDLAFFWGGGTVPEARGRGAYAALIAARLARARALGSSRVGVFARDGTSAPIVAGLGFQPVTRMVFWDRPGPAMS